MYASKSRISLADMLWIKAGGHQRYRKLLALYYVRLENTELLAICPHAGLSLAFLPKNETQIGASILGGNLLGAEIRGDFRVGIEDMCQQPGPVDSVLLVQSGQVRPDFDTAAVKRMTAVTRAQTRMKEQSAAQGSIRLAWRFLNQFQPGWHIVQLWFRREFTVYHSRGSQSASCFC
jgi:hypothetical protein